MDVNGYILLLYVFVKSFCHMKLIGSRTFLLGCLGHLEVLSAVDGKNGYSIATAVTYVGLWMPVALLFFAKRLWVPSVEAAIFQWHTEPTDGSCPHHCPVPKWLEDLRGGQRHQLRSWEKPFRQKSEWHGSGGKYRFKKKNGSGKSSYHWSACSFWVNPTAQGLLREHIEELRHAVAKEQKGLGHQEKCFVWGFNRGITTQMTFSRWHDDKPFHVHPFHLFQASWQQIIVLPMPEFGVVRKHHWYIFGKTCFFQISSYHTQPHFMSCQQWFFWAMALEIEVSFQRSTWVPGKTPRPQALKSHVSEEASCFFLGARPNPPLSALLRLDTRYTRECIYK